MRSAIRKKRPQAAEPGVVCREPDRFPAFPSPGLVALLALLLSVVAISVQAQPERRKQTEVVFSQARDRSAANPKDVEALCHFARACFDFGDYATNATERADVAKLGIEAARSAIKLAPKHACGHYTLGMNLGQLARTRYLSALKLVDEMEAAFKKALELDPKYDFAGPWRNLGLLYREAPSFASIGSRRKAQQHLEKAVEVAPLYLDNRLNLIEAFFKWGDRNGAQREFKALQNSWDEARKAFSDPKWKFLWVDWQTRRDRAAERLKQASPAIKSPHAQ